MTGERMGKASVMNLNPEPRVVASSFAAVSGL